MKPIREILSDKQLERVAGPGAFARGAAYHARSRVDLLSLADDQALARVQGTEIYRVKLRWRGDVAAGSCDCPAFDSTDFCKHMVALAMTVRERAIDGSVIDRRAGLVDFLRQQGLEATVARLLSLAERDPKIWSEIEADAKDAAESDEALVRRYRAEIDTVCDVSGGVDYYAVRSYAEDLSDLLDRMEALNAKGRSTAVAALMVHFIEVMQDVVGGVDDSEGEVSATVQRALDIHVAACEATTPDPVKLAQWLFVQEVNSDWPAFEGLRIGYSDVLGEVGMAEYRRLAKDSWATTPIEHRHARSVLRDILDGFAQEDGDLDARIALYSADLSRPYDYMAIVRLCMEAARDDLALKWARDGLWVFEDARDVGLVSVAAHLEEKAGRNDEALAILWRAFERWPDLALLKDIRRLSPLNGVEQAIAILKAKGLSSMLFELLLAESRLDGAWEIASHHPIAEHQLKALADASHKTHRPQALALYERLIDSNLGFGAPRYDAVIELVRLRGQVCDQPASQGAYIADLAKRHKAKRTFIPRLEALL